MNEPLTKLTTIAHTTKYPVDAFRFVQQALDFTVRRMHGNEGSSEESRHVTGRDLCKGIRDYALQQYGLLALTVLSRWHIHSCEDFGHIVFAMVDAQMMRKTEEDSIRDFMDVYDFQQAFSPPLELTSNS